MSERTPALQHERRALPRMAVVNTNYLGGGAAAVARAIHLGTNRRGRFESTFFHSYGPGCPGAVHDGFVVRNFSSSAASTALKCRTTNGESTSNVVRIGRQSLKGAAALSFRLMGSDRPVVAANTRRYLSRVAEFDLVHLHNLHGYYLDAIGFLNGLDRPFVWTLHDSWAVTGRCALALDCDRWHTAGCSPCPDLKQNPGTWWLDRAGRDLIERREAIANLLRRQRGYLVAPSRWLAERIIQSGVDPARVKVIPNPVDTDVFRPIADRRTLRPELGLPVEPSLILCFAARLDDTVKGGRELHQLIERFRGDQDKHFVLIGSAGKELRGPNCTALGYIGSPERLAKIYAACDLFVSTSRTESFSLCAAEAMSAGTPVVGFRVAALPELVISETGRLIAAGDVEALACEIDALLAKDGQAALQAMSRAARSRSLETWSAPRVLDQYDALYRELLEPTNTESRAA